MAQVQKINEVLLAKCRLQGKIIKELKKKQLD